MHIRDPSHYSAIDDSADDEYAKLQPSGGYTVRLQSKSAPSSVETYTVMLFHQLKCLEILRLEHRAGGSQPLARHCLNYLRESILCRPNLRLEPAQNAIGSAIRGYDAACNDWQSVYAAAEENYVQWSRMKASRDL
jgi:hypothetical protein